MNLLDYKYERLDKFLKSKCHHRIWDIRLNYLKKAGYLTEKERDNLKIIYANRFKNTNNFNLFVNLLYKKLIND